MGIDQQHHSVLQCVKRESHNVHRLIRSGRFVPARGPVLQVPLDLSGVLAGNDALCTSRSAHFALCRLLMPELPARMRVHPWRSRHSDLVTVQPILDDLRWVSRYLSAQWWY